MTGDRKLESAFRALRDEDAGRAPDFDHVLARARQRRGERRAARVRRGAAALLAAAALTFALARTLQHVPSGALADELMATSGLWRAPTDALLEGRAAPLWRASSRSLLRVPTQVRDDG